MSTIVNKTTRVPAVSAEIEGAILTLTFAGGDKLTLDSGKLSEDVRAYALMHGLKQKLVDAAAIARNTDTGASATIADKQDAVTKVYERIIAGEWNATRTGGEGGTGKGSLLFLALLRMQPTRDQAELAASLEGFTTEQRAALAKNAKVLPHIQAIQAERAAAMVAKSGENSDALLDTLLG